MVKKNKERCQKIKKGTALVAAMLMLFMVMALGMAFTTLALDNNNEVVSSVNYHTASQIALAGLNMSNAVLVTGKANSWDDELVQSQSNYASYPSDPWSPTPLAVDTTTAGFQFGRNIDYNGGLFMATVTDNDDGDSDLLHDSDNIVNVSVIGMLPDGSKSRYESVYYCGATPPIPPDYAILSGSGTVSTASQILGPKGHIKANGDVWGQGGRVDGDIYTAGVFNNTGGTTVGGTVSQNQPPLPDANFPNLEPVTYKDQADYVFHDNGDVTDKTGTIIYGNAKTSTVMGWRCSETQAPQQIIGRVPLSYYPGELSWSYNGDGTQNGTFYIPGGESPVSETYPYGRDTNRIQVFIINHMLNPASPPWQATILAENVSTADFSLGIVTPHKGGVFALLQGPSNPTKVLAHTNYDLQAVMSNFKLSNGVVAADSNGGIIRLGGGTITAGSMIMGKNASPLSLLQAGNINNSTPLPTTFLLAPGPGGLQTRVVKKLQ
ncbi:MAG: hypothetical protein HZA49_05895 [Planctomycetes bacterium]|nr:hypothetical protein [Planctomycetota bacterium]